MRDEPTDMENPRLRTVIMIYEVDHGWRYRVGQRDDGNYGSPEEAFWAANNVVKNHPEWTKVDRG